ncbi:MAG: hypothetical protein O6766_05065, partial [Gammaproteobacteria bacterium]|nr:hypothetical protein [Gammaproteobacteria bacterium]
YAACFLPAILFGLHWQRGSAIGVLTSMVLGVVTLVSWMLFGPRDVVHEVFPALAVSCLAYVTIARATPPAIQRWPDERVPGSPGGY